MGWTAPRRALVLMVGFAIAMEACSGGSGAMTAPSAPAGTATRSSPSSAASTNAPGVARLLFTRTAAGDRTAIFAVNADGTGERQLTTMGAYGSVPRVSPDGDRILVMPGRDPLPTPLNGGSIAIDGSGFVPLSATDPSLNLVPQAWSPDGKRIAFEGWDETKPGRTGVYTARFADGGDLVRVTTPQGAPHDIPLDYSPDGTRLVFYRAVRAEPDFPIDIGGSLWVVNVDDANPHQITTSATAPFDWARWSPDGTRILFGAERLQPKGVVWTVGPDGSRLTAIFEGGDGRFPVHPTWSPDGKQILFALDPVADKFTHPANGLYVINADGTGLRLVIGGSDFKSQPEWWR